MKAWAKQIAGTALVLILALGVGSFVMILRAQQGGLAASMSAANIRAVSPPDGAANVPLAGQIRADYIRRPAQDPAIRVEPPVGVTLDGGHWEGTTYVLSYLGLRENSLYHVELDQDDSPNKGEHKQIKVRWSFRTGSEKGVLPKPTATPTPSPTVSISLTASPFPPIALPNMIWYSSPGSSSAAALEGYDWNGHHADTLTWVGTEQSPDGLRIYNAMTPSTDVFDAHGTKIGAIAGLPGLWADDGQQFCGLTYRSSGGTYDLVTMPLDRTIHKVATISPPSVPGTAPPIIELVGCSDLTGRAVVAAVSTNNWITSMQMISLTDGSVIYQTRYPNPLSRIVASHDGRYLAEQLLNAPNSLPRTMIRELPGGTIVGFVTGIVVEGFSWDGSLIAGGVQSNAGFSGAEIIQWKSKATLWQCSCPSQGPPHVIAQPAGSKIAVAVSDEHQAGSITIVDAGGATTSLPVGNQSFAPLF